MRTPSSIAAALLPVLSLSAPETLPAGADEVSWHHGPFANALERAGREERLVVVYFWVEGSEFCRRLYQETISTPAAATALEEFVCVSANAGEPAGAELVARFGVATLPTLLFVGADGRTEDALLGFIGEAGLLDEVERVKSGRGTVSALRRLLDEAPDDLQRRFDLSVKLQDVGATGEATELLDSIRRDDPDGKTVVGAQLILWDVQNAITSAASDPNDPSTYDLEPMYAHLPKVKPESVRFQGWDWVARVENLRGDRPRASRAYEEAWKAIPDNLVGDWGFSLVDLYWAKREELGTRERRFALEVATRVAKRAESLAEAKPEDRFGMDDETYDRYLASILDLLARAQHMRGDARTARATLERALELDPASAELRARLELFR